jgi:hypothetical protein
MTEISRSAQLKRLAKEIEAQLKFAKETEAKLKQQARDAEAAEKEDQKRQTDLQRWSDVAARADASLENRSPYHQATAVEARLAAFAEFERKSKELGYTSLAVALKAVGQQKKTNLPPLYNVAPTQWVQAATLKRVREGLKERVYKVPEVTPARAQTLLKTVRPLLEQLYELWEDEADRAKVEEAYKTLDYDSFVTKLHEILFEELAGVSEVEEEPSVAEAPIPTDEEILSLVSRKGIDYGVGVLD